MEVLDKPVTSTVEVYNPIAAGIALMLEKHGAVLTDPPDVTGNAKALTMVKASRQELVKFRTTLESARKTAKADSLAYGRLVDSEAARIQSFATPLESAYDRIIEAEEKRLAEVREAELQAERQRIAGHKARIQAIKDVRETAALCRTSDRIKGLIDGMPKHLEASFEEFQAEAEAVFNDVCEGLTGLHSVKVEAEVAAVELARKQEEFRLAQIEQKRIDNEARVKREQEEAAATAQRKAEADKLATERAEFQRQQAAAEALARREREAQEAQDRAARAQADADAKAIRDADAAKLRAEREAFELAQAEARQVLQEQADKIAAERLELEAAAVAKAEREALEKQAQEAAAAPVSYQPQPLTAQDIADGVVDAEIKPATHQNGAPKYSTTTFRDDGKPIMLNDDGTRSIFCDLDEEAAPSDEDIICALGEYFEAEPLTVIGWLKGMDLRAAQARIMAVAA